ncbi:hypothetical protein M409DRAFT_17866 [Zasmidium cellare ATCC 36951]|uniref:Uncharacterized protein n=1 Tax=Zasmidium cellare ATCC 36951 TaxID=1080233 RepID=A0A6A6CZK3_ZASCE|nr:uncharacterized protein M409DRAFT_17866 [Zasmidium cellare ATCC 36951]KAF2171630.1 hypothetical protein M409DRAFT_17866 [Zasmidium cellare ATCC 36951]
MSSSAIPAEAILKDYVYDPTAWQRIAHRRITQPLEIVAPNPSWPSVFAIFKDRITAALGPLALEVNHCGSTSIPGLPAKDVIDIDLVVPDPTDEDSYVAALENAGFQFLIREPGWHEHRFFAGFEPQSANLHVWGPNCPEVQRHRIFREWLLKDESDRLLYYNVKEESAKETRDAGGVTIDYNQRKQDVIREILRRAFKDQGYL